MPNIKPISRYIISGFLLFLAFGAIKTTYEVYQSNKRLEDLKKDVTALEARKNALTTELSYYESDAYIEKQARDSLNLAKPGEHIFVSPIQLKISSEQSTQDSVVRGTSPIVYPYYKAWFDLIFKL